MKHHRFWIVIGLILCTTLSLFSQNEDIAKNAYQDAYSCILNEQWEKAIHALDKVIDQHSDSQWIDDAEFWQCFAREKLGRNLEDVYSCYEHFIAAHEESNYVDDAKTNMVRIGKLLVKQGKPRYKNALKAMEKDEDEEVVLTALMALQLMGDEKGLPVILNLYDKNKSFEFREQVLFLLSQFDSPEAGDKLIEIAKTDEDSEIRQKAVFWLGNSSQSDRALDALQEIMVNDNAVSVREHVLFAFGQMGGKGIPILIDVAQNDKNTHLREKAVFWLGNLCEGEEVFAALKSIVYHDSDSGVREQAVFALSQLSDGRGMPVIIEIARTHQDPNMRKKAVFWLSQSGDAKGMHAIIKSIIDTDASLQVRENAVFALAQLETDQSIQTLIDIAKNHSEKEIRKKAIFWLGQSDRDAARDALLNIIQGN